MVKLFEFIIPAPAAVPFFQTSKKTFTGITESNSNWLIMNMMMKVVLIMMLMMMTMTKTFNYHDFVVKIYAMDVFPLGP